MIILLLMYDQGLFGLNCRIKSKAMMIILGSGLVKMQTKCMDSHEAYNPWVFRGGAVKAIHPPMPYIFYISSEG